MTILSLDLWGLLTTMKLASAVDVAVAVNCEKKLKTTHRWLDSRATIIIPRRFYAPIEVRGVRCVVLYQHRVHSGVWFAHITFFSYIFCGTSFNAFTHTLGYYSFAVVLYIGPTIQNFSYWTLLRGNFSHIISTKIVSSAYNFQNLICYKKVIFNIYYRKIFT